MAAEQAIRSSVGRRGPGEPDPRPSGPIADGAPTENDTSGRPQATAGAYPADRLKGVIVTFEKDSLKSKENVEAYDSASWLPRHPDLARSCAG
jgi:hypothetical protein